MSKNLFRLIPSALFACIACVFDGKAQEVLDDADMRQQYLAI